MNKSNLEHLVIAVVLQLALSLLMGLWAAGVAVTLLFLGREIAQHEYGLAVARDWRWGDVMPVKWYEGLTQGWHRDSVLDVACPAGACLLVAVAGWLL